MSSTCVRRSGAHGQFLPAGPQGGEFTIAPVKLTGGTTKLVREAEYILKLPPCKEAAFEVGAIGVRAGQRQRTSNGRSERMGPTGPACILAICSLGHLHSVVLAHRPGRRWWSSLVSAARRAYTTSPSAHASRW